MPFLAEAIFLGFGIVLMLALSQPAELRPGRWLRMACSLPVLLFIHWMFTLGILIFCIGGVVAFTLIWMNHFTWFGAQVVSRLLHGRPNQGGGGFVPDYRGARSRVEDGDYELAIEHVKFELAKEPGNFEGLWLLAAIYQELRQPKQALEAVDRILACPTSTPEQLAAARGAQLRLRALEIQLANERERK